VDSRRRYVARRPGSHRRSDFCDFGDPYYPSYETPEAFGAVTVIYFGVGWFLHWHFQPKAETPGTEKSAISLQFEKAAIPQLGKPTGPIEETPRCIRHHTSTRWWSLLPTLDVFVFPYDRSKKAIRQHTAAWKDERRWFDESYLRSLLHTPKDKLPPENRVAELWSQNPEQWKWIGWRNWSCPFVMGKFYYQKFEQSVIFGVLPTSKNLGQSQVFAYANSGDWSSTISETVEAPACNEKTTKLNGVPIHGRFTR
jgi:hypothetical protein